MPGRIFTWRGPYTTSGVLLVAYVAVTHLFWAALLTASPAAMNATPVSGLAVLGGRPLLVVVLAGSGLGSLFALSVHRWWVMWFMIPQQVLLGLSLGTAGQAVAQQRYADGVLRPWTFIAADQAPTIVLAFAHLVAVILFAERVHSAAHDAPP